MISLHKSCLSLLKNSHHFSKSLLFTTPSYKRFSSNKDSPIDLQNKQNKTPTNDPPKNENDPSYSELTMKDLTFFDDPRAKAPKVREGEEPPPTVVRFDVPDSYKINTEVEFQLKDNPLALKVLKEGTIDLKDKRIKVDSLSMADASLLDANVAGELKQVNLGDIKVVPKDSVMLEDIDVYNIPEDKDIIIEKEEKTLFAIGRKVKRKEELKIVKEGEEGKESKEKGLTETEEKEIKWVHEIGKKIFEEKSFVEFKKENLFSFEMDLLRFNFKELGRAMIGIVPLLAFSFFLAETLMEVYICMRDDHLIEQQEMSKLAEIRANYAKKILVSNPLFDRKNLVKVEFEN